MSYCGFPYSHICFRNSNKICTNKHKNILSRVFFSGFLMWDSSIDGCSECFRLSLCLTTSNYAEVDIPELVSLAKEESWKQGLLGHRRSK